MMLQVIHPQITSGDGIKRLAIKILEQVKVKLVFGDKFCKRLRARLWNEDRNLNRVNVETAAEF